MICGIILSLMGRKLFNVAIFFVGLLATIYGIMILFYAIFFSADTAYWVGWLVLSCSVLLGVVAGYFLCKSIRLGAAIISGWGGYCLGLLLNTLFMYKIGSDWVFWITNIVLIIVCAIAGFLVFNHAIIIGTSFAGSYMFIIGLGMVCGGYTNTYALINEIEAGAISNVDPWTYAYFTGMLVMTVLTAIVQYKQFHKMQEHEKHPYHN